MMGIATRALVLVCILTCQVHGSIVLNELLASTEQDDARGTSLEWVEILNTGDSPVSLRGYSLTDDPLSPRQWFFPAISLAPDETLLVYATGYNWFRDGELHASFQLNREGEWLGLYDSQGNLVDDIRFPEQIRNLSYGRHLQDRQQWGFYERPTPGEVNRSPLVDGQAAIPQFSHQGGVYPSRVEITLTVDDPEATIRYTLDGSTPDETSEEYTEPLSLRRTVAVRARTFRAGMLPSRVATHTYVFRDDTPLPIVSIVTDPQHLWSPSTGIYANASRHGDAWERPTSFEWIDDEGVRQFGVDCGIRIHGGASRQRSLKKSWRLYFRNEYGPVLLDYPLFPDSPQTSFNQLVIRGNFNDAWAYDREMQRVTVLNVRDQTVRWMYRDMGHPVSDGTFAMLYINGEYWGIYNPCERYDEHFMQSHLGGVEWDIIVEDLVREGDRSAWSELVDWARTNDLRNPERYAEVWERMDVENYVDYMLLNIWMQNYDWPHHNWYSARARTGSAKWRFFIWDIEYSFGSGIQGYRIDQNTLDNAKDRSRGSLAILFTELIKNPDFREYLWNRLNYHLDRSLSEAHVRARLEASLATVDPVIPAELERWGGGDKTMADFERAKELAFQFIDERTEHVLRYMSREVGPPPVQVEAWSLY